MITEERIIELAFYMALELWEKAEKEFRRCPNEITHREACKLWGDVKEIENKLKEIRK